MNLLHTGILTSILCLITYSLTSQTRNLHIEGTGDQFGVIQTTSTFGGSISGIELIRGNAFSGTDWRIINDSGTLKFSDGTDNFSTSGTTNLEIASSGRLTVFNGTNSEATDAGTGYAVVGPPSGTHISIDDQGIIARQGDLGSRLLLQTGLDAGDTYLNNISGEVGIGTLAPAAKLGVEDNGYQIRLGNTEDLTNDWYIGASHDNWTIGADKLAIGPSSSSGNAMLVLDKDEDVISVRSNRIISLEDPENDRDAVNLRTLIAYTRVTEISNTLSNRTFAECAFHCQILNESGHDDWKVASLNQLLQFIDPFGSSGEHWTSDHAGTYLPESGGGITFPVNNVMLVLDMQNAGVGARTITSDAECTCVR